MQKRPLRGNPGTIVEGALLTHDISDSASRLGHYAPSRDSLHTTRAMVGFRHPTVNLSRYGCCQKSQFLWIGYFGNLARNTLYAWYLHPCANFTSVYLLTKIHIMLNDWTLRWVNFLTVLVYTLCHFCNSSLLSLSHRLYHVYRAALWSVRGWVSAARWLVTLWQWFSIHAIDNDGWLTVCHSAAVQCIIRMLHSSVSRPVKLTVSVYILSSQCLLCAAS